MGRVFKSRHFHRWMLKTDLTDASLCRAVEEMQQGLIDAELGGGLVKKRVAVPGRGKSGSTRTILATNKVSRWFFIFGFAKNERANITTDELKALKLLSSDLLQLSAAGLDAAVKAGTLWEICHGNQSKS